MRAWVLGLAACAALAAGPACAEPSLGSRIIVLSDADVRAYTRAFAAAEAGDSSGAEAALRTVEDPVLAGGVRLKIYTRPASKPSDATLLDWLQAYSDHPGAEKLRALAAARGVAWRASPKPRTARAYINAAPAPRGDTEAARAAIEATAQAFAAGDFVGAETRARAALSGPRAHQAHWWLGLNAFRVRSYAQAAAAFAAAAASPYQDGWGKSAAHYWAGRSRLAAGAPAEALNHFQQAAKSGATFYGQLAAAQLGQEGALSLATAPLSATEARSFLQKDAGAYRAAALAQLGRLADAEAELRVLFQRLPEHDTLLYLRFAEALKAPAAQLRAAEYGDPSSAAGHCPVTSFAPDRGFILDRALILAVMRQESRFDPAAVSRSNARGLMQLLPATAADMGRSLNIRTGTKELADPTHNAEMGQAYLQWLALRVRPQGDVAMMLAAYNGGPGWLSRWLAGWPYAHDPLLTLEALPRAESREYAERVLSHMALCRKRAGQPTLELDALASGKPAIYRSLERLDAQ